EVCRLHEHGQRPPLGCQKRSVLRSEPSQAHDRRVGVPPHRAFALIACPAIGALIWINRDRVLHKKSPAAARGPGGAKCRKNVNVPETPGGTTIAPGGAAVSYPSPAAPYENAETMGPVGSVSEPDRCSSNR